MEVSKGFNQDKLAILMLGAEELIKPESEGKKLVLLKQDSSVLIPKQMENTAATKNLLKASAVSKNSLKVITVVAIFFQFLGSNSAVYMVELINSL